MENQMPSLATAICLCAEDTDDVSNAPIKNPSCVVYFRAHNKAMLSSMHISCVYHSHVSKLWPKRSMDVLLTK